MAGRIEREIQNGKPLGSLEVEAVLNIQRTAAFLAEWTNGVLEPAGLQGDEYNVLRILRGAGSEGRTQAEIRARMIQGSERMAALLHKLRTRGWTEGGFRVSITDSGRELLSALDGKLEASIRAHLAGIEPAKLRVAVDVLERMRTA